VVYEFRLDDPLPAELRLRPLLEDRLRVALPPDHRLAGRRPVAPEDLAGDA
jgi:DNA-binding transcriptional LysR family regulator